MFRGHRFGLISDVCVLILTVPPLPRLSWPLSLPRRLAPRVELGDFGAGLGPTPLNRCELGPPEAERASFPPSLAR